MNYSKYFSQELARIHGIILNSADSIAESDFNKKCHLDKIPVALKEYYLLAGNHTINHEYNRLIPVEKLAIADGFLIFMEENQHLCCWAIRESDLLFPDPEVTRIDNILDDAESNIGHLTFTSEKKFSAFITEMVCRIQQEIIEADELLPSEKSNILPSEKRIERIGNIRKELPKYFVALAWPQSDNLFDFYIIRNNPVKIIYGVLTEKIGLSLDYVPCMPSNLEKDKDLITIECMKVIREFCSSSRKNFKNPAGKRKKIDSIRREIPPYFIAIPWPQAVDFFDYYIIRNTHIVLTFGILLEKSGTYIDYIPCVPDNLYKDEDLIAAECMKVFCAYYSNTSK